ncbi:MAG: single-stranded-DNA-specific exonuclease RecJ [Planctomycetota bacterium]|nr:single-stranded-DNA-specific exonuclease RecJ [Planctomycetota bacterium]MED5447131.1 single-stranded-DNA-specific exonuclease RecJ [Planctomycetota bacterium]MEE3283440.1 single-stranded-DNA-specific exonuclease RecJ [Planctomycetota bacterium]
MARIWRYAVHDAPRVKSLSASLGVPALVAQVLLARGVESAEDAREFLSARLTDLHDPSLLPGIDEAADRVVSAIGDGRQITIYGDYDVDGVTGTSLLWHCLTLAGAQVDYSIPDRLNDGYGLNPRAIRSLAAEDQSRLLISVDCGIASIEEAALAAELGMELIVTDHHTIGETLPAAAVLVHPRLPGSEYPFGDLCGAAVAFKLAWAICQRLGDGRRASPRMKEFLLSAVGLAAIGTISDVMPLLGENRVLVRFGLAGLPGRASVGLKALLDVSEKQPPLEAEDIAFAIGPRINAAGRLQQARLAVELLTTSDEHKARQLATHLDKLNKDRRSLETRILKQAKKQVAENPEWEDAAALVLASPDWHAGVIGIVANRVAEEFEKPAVMLALSAMEGTGKGSGRSFAGFDLYSGIAACSDHLLTFGGHHAAAGLSIRSENVAAFREAFSSHVAEHHVVTDEDRELRVDAEVHLSDISRKAVNALDSLSPFGQGNPRPRFSASGVELAEDPQTMGEGDRHLRLSLKTGNRPLKAVAFGRGEWAEPIRTAEGPLSICFEPMINRWRGRESVELRLIDWKSGTGLD